MVRRTADVVVIGGGVLGAATLLELAERGLDAVLLERALPGRQGSGTTAGNLHIQAIHAARPAQAVPVDTARLVPLQRIASELWRQVPDRLGRDVQVTRSGGLTVAETDAELALLREKAGWERDAGIATEVLDAAGAREAEPALGPDVLGATWCADDGYANPLLVTPAYLAAARAHGARVYPGAEVTGLHAEGDTWRVESRMGAFSAARVVNAAGPWLAGVSELAGLPLTMTPTAIQMLETARTPRFLERLVQHIGVGLSVKQVLAGSVVIGGGWPAGELQLGTPAPVLDASVDGNLADAVRIVPRVGELRLSRAWSGPLATTPDEMPVIGEAPGSPGMFLEGGTYSFTFSPLWARITADLVQGIPPAFDVADLAPDRLVPLDPQLHDLAPQPEVNAR